MRAYYLTGLAAIAAMAAPLSACGGSERNFTDDTGGSGGSGNTSSGGTGNTSSGGTGNTSSGGTGNTSSGGTGASSSGGTGASSSGGTGAASSGGTGAASSGGSGGSVGGSGGTGASASGGTGGSVGGTGGTGGGTQTVQCDDDNSNPANSSDVIADVTITYDPNTMTWSPPEKCDWDCNTNYCEDAGQCLSSKSVACDPDNSNPANSSDMAGNVTVTCSGTTFSAPAKCGWTCNTNYCQEGGGCLSSKSVPCNTNNSNPANSTDVTGNVNISCTSGGTWPSAPLCNWTCNSGYVQSGNSCVRPIYMFDSGGSDDPVGGRSALDTRCRNARSASFSTLPSTRVRAFVSVSSADEIRDMPSVYGYSTSLPIVGPTGTKIADNWADLLDGTIDTSLGAAGVTSNFWYSGSLASGQVNLNCSGWTTSTVAGATYGRGVFTDSQWMTTGSATCAIASYHYLCLASL